MANKGHGTAPETKISNKTDRLGHRGVAARITSSELPDGVPFSDSIQQTAFKGGFFHHRSSIVLWAVASECVARGTLFAFVPPLLL
jgi:hypothetical protein